jgi:hypothetical protein
LHQFWKELRSWHHSKIHHNCLSGQIPGYLSTMSTLKRLELNSNFFTGTIPLELADLPNLEFL